MTKNWGRNWFLARWLSLSELSVSAILNRQRATNKYPYSLHSPTDLATFSGHKHRNCDHIITKGKHLCHLTS